MPEGREWGVGSVVVESAFGAPQSFGPNLSKTLYIKCLGTSGLLPSSQKQLQAKKKTQDLGFSLSWIAKAKAKEHLWNFTLFCKCGLLLWLVRAQHDHYESKGSTNGAFVKRGQTGQTTYISHVFVNHVLSILRMKRSSARLIVSYFFTRPYVQVLSTLMLYQYADDIHGVQCRHVWSSVSTARWVHAA